MLGVYNYTVVLTYEGMLIGVFGMTRAMQGDLQSALFCLMLAGFCDMFDGKIASTKMRTQQEKRFGIQIVLVKHFCNTSGFLNHKIFYAAYLASNGVLYPLYE